LIYLILIYESASSNFLKWVKMFRVSPKDSDPLN